MDVNQFHSVTDRSPNVKMHIAYLGLDCYLAPMQLFSELEHYYLGAATMTDRKIEAHKVKLSHPLYIKVTRSTCSQATHVTQCFVGEDLFVFKDEQNNHSGSSSLAVLKGAKKL